MSTIDKWLLTLKESGVNSLFAAAAPTRRGVFERLRQRGASVGGIAAELALSRAAVSQRTQACAARFFAQSHPQNGRLDLQSRARADSELSAFLLTLLPDRANLLSHTTCTIGDVMDYDDVKLQEAVLALLGVFEFENGRVWKRYDFSVMDALHEQGWIADPRGRAESVYLTEAGRSKAKELATKLFGAKPKQ